MGRRLVVKIWPCNLEFTLNSKHFRNKFLELIFHYQYCACTWKSLCRWRTSFFFFFLLVQCLEVENTKQEDLCCFSPGQRRRHCAAEVGPNWTRDPGSPLWFLCPHQTPAGPAEGWPPDCWAPNHWRCVWGTHGRGELQRVKRLCKMVFKKK